MFRFEYDESGAAAVLSTSAFFCTTCAAGHTKIWAPECKAQAYFRGQVGLCVMDSDGDGLQDCDDQCPITTNNADEDGDIICDAIDSCPDDDANVDQDDDAVCDQSDRCIVDNDADQDCLDDSLNDPCPGDVGNNVAGGGDAPACACEAEDPPSFYFRSFHGHVAAGAAEPALEVEPVGADSEGNRWIRIRNKGQQPFTLEEVIFPSSAQSFGYVVVQPGIKVYVHVGPASNEEQDAVVRVSQLGTDHDTPVSLDEETAFTPEECSCGVDTDGDGLCDNKDLCPYFGSIAEDEFQVVSD